jgi:hypothetical protein
MQVRDRTSSIASTCAADGGLVRRLASKDRVLHDAPGFAVD